MKLKVAQTRIQFLQSKKNTYFFLALGSIIVNIMLAFLLFISYGSQKIILVPPEIEKPLWISGTKISNEYLSSISLYLLNLLINVNPSNVDMQHALLLNQIDNSTYQIVKTNLLLQAEKIKKEHLTSNFQVFNVKVDSNNYISKISGYLQFKVGEESQTKKFVIYQMKFRYKDGKLKLNSFEELNSEKNN